MAAGRRVGGRIDSWTRRNYAEPDVVVMDIEMPRQDGLVATRRLRELAPKAVVVTAHRAPGGHLGPVGGHAHADST
jgi:CheY-like chemotaxis protein